MLDWLLKEVKILKGKKICILLLWFFLLLLLFMYMQMHSLTKSPNQLSNNLHFFLRDSSYLSNMVKIPLFFIS